MRLFQRFLLFLLVVISAQATFAQRGPTFLAEQAFNKGDYYDAAALYKKAFKFGMPRPSKQTSKTLKPSCIMQML